MRVLLAMSGGVDSSVAGALLLEQGHDVVGVTMKLWGGESDSGCCSVSDVDDARRVAQQLDIDHVVFNFGEDFDAFVVDPYVRDHARGVTPNPCVECNRHLKFDRLLDRADELGFDAVATGHHARVGRTDDCRYTLERGADASKDQSYVVHMLDQRSLARTLFPVGHVDKAEVRRIAARLGLRTAAKPDSQDVCFITSAGGRAAFLGDRIAFRPGRVVDTSGEHLGTVDAVELVTIGQRRGLGLPGGGPKRYVVDVRHASRGGEASAADAADAPDDRRGDDVDLVPAATVVVGGDADLHVASTLVEQVTWVDAPVEGDVLVQCSAHGATRPARIGAIVDGRLEVGWREPQRRIAPGQSVVFYDGDDRCVLGGGVASVG